MRKVSLVFENKHLFLIYYEFIINNNSKLLIRKIKIKRKISKLKIRFCLLFREDSN
jgi:hypothetical protein